MLGIIKVLGTQGFHDHQQGSRILHGSAQYSPFSLQALGKHAYRIAGGMGTHCFSVILGQLLISGVDGSYTYYHVNLYPGVQADGCHAVPGVADGFSQLNFTLVYLDPVLRFEGLGNFLIGDAAI